jgi:simple sugar transport system substrate-binding protein
MRKTLALLLALMMILSMTTLALAESKDISEYTVVMIVKQSDPWFDDMEAGVNKLKEDTGLNAYVLTPESGDPALQIAIMEDLISQGVDAICIVPNDPQALIPTIKKAREAGIAVVTHEAPGIADSVDMDVEAFVNADFGALMGKAVVDPPAARASLPALSAG